MNCPFFFFKRLAESVLCWGVFNHRVGDNKQRVEGVYPPGLLCPFLSYEQIFILPGYGDISLFLSHSVSPESLASSPPFYSQMCCLTVHMCLLAFIFFNLFCIMLCPSSHNPKGFIETERICHHDFDLSHWRLVKHQNTALLRS